MRYVSIRREIEGALPTVMDLARERRETEALQVVSQAEVDLQETGYDNWNGGTPLWTAYFRIPVALFIKVEPERSATAEIIRRDLELVLGRDPGYVVSVEILPAKTLPRDQKLPDGQIANKTRAAVLDEMRARETVWYGALDEIAFLSRIFDLGILPSSDSRFENAEGDIWQHCIANNDWNLDWVYSDRRFKLYSADQSVFLKFICEVIHPIVRRDSAEQMALADAFNGHLRADGWELVEDVLIASRPVYVAQRKVHALGLPLQRIRAVAATLDAETLYEDLRRLERAGDNEPAEAIGVAKEIVESCCKLILDDRGAEYPPSAEIPELLKLLRKELQIMPDGIDENARGAEQIRDILTSLGKIAHSLAPLRNVYGKGHGRGRDFKGLQPRHARLAIGAASTFADFVLDRHLSQKRKTSDPDTPTFPTAPSRH